MRAISAVVAATGLAGIALGYFAGRLHGGGRAPEAPRVLPSPEPATVGVVVDKLKPQPVQPELVEEAPQAGLRQEALSWPDIHVGGIRVVKEEKECRLIFEEGLFTYRTEMVDWAGDLLRDVAQALRGHMGGFRLIVEGHTDSMPVGGVSSSFRSNQQIGLARAQKIRDELAALGLRPEDMEAVSVGEADPPYPNTDEISRRKNRTVVLKLVPRDAGR
jgi:outer membrane protein OmpA-like peptidoglycan-associated protein